MDDDKIINLNDINLKDTKKNIFKYINSDRYKVFRGYKLDKFIFQFIMFSIFGLMFFIAYSNNFELNYFNCPSNPTVNIFNMDSSNNCINPFYEPSDWTNEKTLPPGEYGFIPGPLFNNLGTTVFILFTIGLLLNHLIYNKNYFKKGGFNNGDKDKKFN